MVSAVCVLAACVSASQASYFGGHGAHDAHGADYYVSKIIHYSLNFKT
jgi:hypothetical protein